MMDIRELYQEMIIDHNRNPRHHYAMAHATTEAQGFNPLCGDKLTVYLKLEQQKVTDISFVGCGCAISQASASMMTEAICGKTIDEAHHLFEKFHQFMTSDEPENVFDEEKLAVLSGVRVFPARVKCATLAWHTLDAALRKDKQPVSTE